MEMLLPALVFVDQGSGAISSPHVLARARGAATAHDLIAHGDVLWVLWARGVTRYDPRSREQIDVSATPIALASNRAGVFGLFGNGEIARLDELDRGVAVVGQIPTPATHLAAATNAVYGLTWTDSKHEITTLTARDLQRGTVRWDLQLHGAPYGLVVDDDSLWVNLWRRQPDAISGHVVEIAAEDGSVRGELEIRPTGRIDPVADGHHVRTRVPGRHGDTGDRPPQLERLDLRTGETTALAALDGRLGWPVLGPTAVWGRLQPTATRASTVVAVPLDGAAPRYYDVSAVDTSAYLPPRPPPIEAERTEQQIRQRLADALFAGWVANNPDSGQRDHVRPYIRGVTIQTVERHGSFPNTQIVITFCSDAHPGIRFARRQRIWDDDGAVSAVIRFMDINLKESIEACGHGLPPTPQPDASGTVWF